jgi:hypothetical protein
MSEAMLEAAESEAYEAAGEAAYEGEGTEAAYEGESAGEAAYEGYGEDARSDARRRSRQRQIMLARQRQAQLRRGQPPPRPIVTAPGPAMRAVRSEVHSLDLETKVALDSLRNRLNEANRLAYRNAWAAEASAAASQVLDSFEHNLKPHDWARALIRGAPTLLLAPGKPRKPGIEGILFDPRVGGGALLAAIWAVGHFRSEPHGVSSISVPGAQTVTVRGTVPLYGIPVDQKGYTVANVTPVWSFDSTYVSLSATTGVNVTCTGVLAMSPPTTTTVTVTGGGVTNSIAVTVT